MSTGDDQYEAEFYPWWWGAGFAEMFYKREAIPEGTFSQGFLSHGFKASFSILNRKVGSLHFQDFVRYTNSL